MKKVRICVPFYAEKDLHEITGVLMDIITKNNLAYSVDQKTGLLTSFHTEKYSFHYEPRQGTRIKDARNSLISDTHTMAIDQKPLDMDFFLCLDSDIVFTLDNLLRLLQYNLPIIGSPYCTHQDRTVSNVCEVDELGMITKRFPMATTGVREVGALPGGFTLIKKEVFENTDFPWFYEPMVEYGDSQRQEMGEDMGFCKRAREAGYSIVCDFDNPVEHRQRKINWSPKSKFKNGFPADFSEEITGIIESLSSMNTTYKTAYQKGAVLANALQKVNANGH